MKGENEPITGDALRQIAGMLYVLADALDAGTARYAEGSITIDTAARAFDVPTDDGRVRTVTAPGRHGFPHGSVTIRSDIGFLTGQPSRA